MKPEFEESQFGALFQDSVTRQSWLRRNRVMVVPIGQVLEARLGFDVAWWFPRRHRIWGTLGVPGLPGLPRSSWAPDISEPIPVTGRAINLFFQFKRSDYLYGANAMYRQHFREPYWRFRVDRTVNPASQPQHDLLEALESRVGSKALVRYVAPRFHEFSELEVLAAKRQVAEHCVYVPPSDFSPDHVAYHFTASDQLVNPEPDARDPADWNTFFQVVAARVSNAPLLDGLLAEAPGLFDGIDALNVRELGYPWVLPRDVPELARALITPLLPAARFLFEHRIAWYVGVEQSLETHA